MKLLQDFEGAGAVFPGGADVAADVEAVLGDVAARFRRNSGLSLPGFCFTVILGPGTRGTADRPNVAAPRNSRGSPV